MRYSTLEKGTNLIFSGILRFLRATGSEYLLSPNFQFLEKRRIQISSISLNELKELKKNEIQSSVRELDFSVKPSMI